MTEEERQAYREYMVSVHAAQDAIETAKSEGIAEGREEGRAEGREEGRAQGREEGRAEGRAEGREEANRDNAIKMKKKGIPDDLIAEITGLPVSEIQLL